MHTFEQQLNKPKLQPFWAGFVSAKRKTSFSDATSTVWFFCNRRQKLVVRSCSVPNSPTEKWKSCSEWIIWPEFLHGCGKFGSWFQNLPVSWLQLSFQLSKMNVLDVAVNSDYNRLTIISFNQIIFLEVKYLSSSSCSKTSSASGSCESDLVCVYVRVGINHMSCLV